MKRRRAKVLIRAWFVSAIAAPVAVLVVSSAASAQLTFEDQTTMIGLTANHVPDDDFIAGNEWSMSGGLAVGDFNGDAYPDIFWISGGSEPDKLFINDGAGSFVNEATAWGLTDLHCGSGASAADYDGDGDIDLYVTSWGNPAEIALPGKHRLYRNDGGTFAEVAAAAGVNSTSASDPGGYGSAWGDYDLDGDLDLFVAQWFILADGNRLYENQGDGTFQDVTATALGSLAGVWGFQPVFADMNGDRWPELMLSADFGTSRYFVNDGDGTFTNMTSSAGVGIDDHGMGNTVGDVNNDGLLDWYVTSIHKDKPAPGEDVGNMLYVNQGADMFLERSNPSGCNDGGWGWGATAADLDHDGWLDIVEVNGRAGSGEWDTEPAKLFHNQTAINGGTLTFVESAAAAGFVHAAQGTAVACLDTDRDGDLDIVSFANDGALKYFENKTSNPGGWVVVDLDTSANDLLAPNGFGTRVTVTAQGKTYTRYVDGRPSYLATGESDLHFGLGTATEILRITVEWARGQVTTVDGPSLNQFLTITAPALGDLDDDGDVDFGDLLGVIGAWGTGGASPADLNADGDVGFADVLVLISLWG